MRYIILFLMLTLLIAGCKFTNNHTQIHNPHVIAFYNLENLFDTINDVGVYDGEFTPSGSKAWNTERYVSKQQNLSKVIADLGTDQGIDGPTLIGLCEVENRSVLEDLIHSDKLKDKGYSIIHFDSPDKRGIDVALLYKPSAFWIEKTQLFPLIIQSTETGKRLYTRDQLLVSGKLEGDPIHVIVNHWPSRYGGQKRSLPSRKSAALLNRQIIDSLLHINRDAKIITMGDLNDDPTDESVHIHLDAHTSQNNLEHNNLYNPLAMNFKEGKGTLFYRGKWNLFDQLIISRGLLDSSKGFQYDSAYIYKKPYLIQQDGDYKGYLLRTYGGGNYLNGYSDHLPVYLVLSPN
ncbi:MULTISPECIES: endonuclease/exonuclease/phosphatase family protein [unclassified Saccharicrinis]|uniref:endonuclease/exonuclease/phosphatase family protein n=1 Tax=unclassified Saccharicrinis TaxID=2646859 RepID=UPI003D341F33